MYLSVFTSIHISVATSEAENILTVAKSASIFALTFFCDIFILSLLTPLIQTVYQSPPHPHPRASCVSFLTNSSMPTNKLGLQGGDMQPSRVQSASPNPTLRYLLQKIKRGNLGDGSVAKACASHVQELSSTPSTHLYSSHWAAHTTCQSGFKGFKVLF